MAKVRQKGKTLGFVPTMGALHAGHVSLIKKAREENDIVLVSIFVNPGQFGTKEDLKKYPRPRVKDHKLLKAEGVDYLFEPKAGDMYPVGFSSAVAVGEVPSPCPLPSGERVRVRGISHVLCGKFRPGHFRGVATVVTKLFNLAGACRAYFGAKDYQQSVIVRRLIRDLNLDIELRVLPTIREKDGLALSSRNRYLNPGERKKARAIPETLFWMRNEILHGVRDLPKLRRQGIAQLKQHVDRIDYLEIVDPETLESLEQFQPEMVLAAACYVGKTRLIDNVTIRPSKK